MYTVRKVIIAKNVYHAQGAESFTIHYSSHWMNAFFFAAVVAGAFVEFFVDSFFEPVRSIILQQFSAFAICFV